MKGLIVMAGLACLLVVGLSCLVFFILVVKRLRTELAAGGVDYDSQPGGFHDRMKEAIAALPPDDPMRAWGVAFGGIGHVENDPHTRYLHFREGPGNP